MAFKKMPPEQKKGAGDWMATYGDMITLMLCFFVMLYAMSNVDVQKFAALAESYAGRPVVVQEITGDIATEGGQGLLPDTVPGEPPTPKIDVPEEEQSEADKLAAAAAREKQLEIENMASNFKTYLAQNTATNKIAVDVLGDYIRITFPDGMLFDSGKAILKLGAIDALDVVTVELAKYMNNWIRVEGHTDTVPMNSAQYPSNRHLSSARADTVVEYLVNQKHFNPLMMSSEGMGEYFPIDTNETPEGRANNRRVEIKVYADQSLTGLSIPLE